MTIKPNFIDLFCGCGGLSLGLRNAGFKELAAIDNDPVAIEIFKKNIDDNQLILERDLTQYSPNNLTKLLMDRENIERLPEIDLIVGGPPCQGFSNARRRDGSNHGANLKEDSRRELYQEFLRYIKHFKPKIFVFENVLGIRTAAGGNFFARVQSEARDLGYRVHGEQINAWEYGVPQKRIRQLIIGTRNDLPLFSSSIYMPKKFLKSAEINGQKLHKPINLWEAIGDLPSLEAGEGSNTSKYDLKRQMIHLNRYGNRYLKNVIEIHKSKKLYNHVARPQSERDLRDFARLKEGESSAIAMRERQVKFEWPYNKEHFKDRYTRQHRNRLCSTIVAHLGKDGLMFIHPTQNRSLTVREAARIQSFPDWFLFPSERTHAFRLIGNAVPPILAKNIGHAIKSYLKSIQSEKEIRLRTDFPKDINLALAWMQDLVQASKQKALANVSNIIFSRGWKSINFFCYTLHPDAAKQNGSIIGAPSSSLESLKKYAPTLVKKVYVQSGWPVVFMPIALEARRRLNNGALKKSDYYCSEIINYGRIYFEKRENK